MLFGTHTGLGPNSMKVPKSITKKGNPFIELGNQYGAKNFKEFMM
jgi:hypothetical protein